MLENVRGLHLEIDRVLDLVPDPTARARLAQLRDDLTYLTSDDVLMRFAVREGRAEALPTELRRPPDQIIDLAIAEDRIDGLPPRWRELALTRVQHTADQLPQLVRARVCGQSREPVRKE